MNNKVEIKRSLFGYKTYLIIITMIIIGASINTEDMLFARVCAFCAGWVGMQLLIFKGVDSMSMIDKFFIGREDPTPFWGKDDKPLRALAWKDILKIEIEQTRFQRFFNYGTVITWVYNIDIENLEYRFTYVKNPRLVRQTWLAANLKPNL